MIDAVAAEASRTAGRMPPGADAEGGDAASSETASEADAASPSGDDASGAASDEGEKAAAAAETPAEPSASELRRALMQEQLAKLRAHNRERKERAKAARESASYEQKAKEIEARAREAEARQREAEELLSQFAKNPLAAAKAKGLDPLDLYKAATAEALAADTPEGREARLREAIERGVSEKLKKQEEALQAALADLKSFKEKEQQREAEKQHAAWVANANYMLRHIQATPEYRDLVVEYEAEDLVEVADAIGSEWSAKGKRYSLEDLAKEIHARHVERDKRRAERRTRFAAPQSPAGQPAAGQPPKASGASAPPKTAGPATSLAASSVSTAAKVDKTKAERDREIDEALTSVVRRFGGRV